MASGVPIGYLDPCAHFYNLASVNMAVGLLKSVWRVSGLKSQRQCKLPQRAARSGLAAR